MHSTIRESFFLSYLWFQAPLALSGTTFTTLFICTEVICVWSPFKNQHNFIHSGIQEIARLRHLRHHHFITIQNHTGPCWASGYFSSILLYYFQSTQKLQNNELLFSSWHLSDIEWVIVITKSDYDCVLDDELFSCKSSFIWIHFWWNLVL